MATPTYSITTTVTNLGETDIIVPDTADYIVSVTNQARNIDPVVTTYGAGGGAGTGTNTGTQTQSAIVTVVKVNSSTKYTSNAGDRGLLTSVSASAGDTIKIITSSTAASDKQPQAVQTTIAISQGDL